MSEKTTKPLSHLLTLISDRTGIKKDWSRPYVGLEHIPSAGSSLLAVGDALDSVSTNGIFAAGDTLFGKLRPRLRKSIRAKVSGYCSTDILVLRPTGNVDPVFAGFVSQSDAVFLAAIRTEEGTKMPRCSWRDLKSVAVFCPVEKTTQQKIATVLTSIDAAIEKTEALIGKYRQIKTGLMHDLFTRGVLPNGQLRPPREQAPELYQETVIGWIPREWDLETLESLLAPVPNNIRSGPFGSALLKHELVESGIPFLGIDNIHIESFNAEFRRFVSPKKFNELAKYAVRKRDVVITIMGTVGRSCVIPDNLEIALSSKHLWTMTFDLDRSVPRLICWQLNHSPWVKSWFRRAAQGGVMDAIQSKTLKRLLLPLPPPDEQQRIDTRYGVVSSQIEREEQSLQKLKLQKLGLMQDLLTGKVPVTVDTQHNAPTHAE